MQLFDYAPTSIISGMIFTKNDLLNFQNQLDSSLKKKEFGCSPKMPLAISFEPKNIRAQKFTHKSTSPLWRFLTTFLVGKSTLFLMSISKIFFTQVPTTKTREKIDKFFFAYLLPKTLGFLLMYFSNRIRTCSTLNEHETCFIFFSMSNLYIVIQIPKWYTFYISETHSLLCLLRHGPSFGVIIFRCDTILEHAAVRLCSYLDNFRYDFYKKWFVKLSKPIRSVTKKVLEDTSHVCLSTIKSWTKKSTCVVEKS